MTIGRKGQVAGFGVGDCPANSRESTDRCPKCFESVTLIQPQHKGGAFKGPAKGHCLNCMDEQEYDLTVPAKNVVYSCLDLPL
jgi:hypothetical protein